MGFGNGVGLVGTPSMRAMYGGERSAGVGVRGRDISTFPCMFLSDDRYDRWRG